MNISETHKRVQEFVQNGKFVTILGNPSSKVILLKQPVGIAFDDAGKVYILDEDTNKVLVFAPALMTFRSQIGSAK